MIQEIKLINKAINTFLDFPMKSKNISLKKVFFLRNEQVENLAEKINNYSAISKLKFKFFFSGYNNNLPITQKKYDIGIIWLDYTEYKINSQFLNWIKSKADELSFFCDYVLIKPILIPNTKFSKIFNLNKNYKKIFRNEKVIFLDILNELFENYEKIWDVKRSIFFGTKTSLYGLNLQSKLLGLKVFPSLFNQKIKSIIFDLDDTLYTGVIGEDGIKKIYLDKNQKKAEKVYSSLRKNGTLLSICSKNNESDVNKVFKKKKLKKKLFFPIKTNWDYKSKNIQDIQKVLKISYHNILFIDNNISEVVEVKKKIPDINVFWSHNSESLINCLKYYPNIADYFHSNFEGINNKRIIDLKASLKREKLLKNIASKNHFKLLKMKIEYRLNNIKEFDRIFSLTNKVNQFIFTYKRFSKSQIKEYIENKYKYVFTISLKDSFSDSGNIGVVFFSIKDHILYLDELCISCRALGRNLEDYFIFYPLKILSKKTKFKSLVIKFTNGPKNEPAAKYFNELQQKIFNKKTSNYEVEIPFSITKTIININKDISINYKN
jgi:FkbH-like protein